MEPRRCVALYKKSLPIIRSAIGQSALDETQIGLLRGGGRWRRERLLNVRGILAAGADGGIGRPINP
jgi:hypothetical protein